MSNITRAMFQAASGSTGAGDQFMWAFGSGNNGDDTILTGVGVDSSDDIIVTGTTKEDGAGNVDLFIAKISSGGSLLWKKTYGTSNNESLAYGNSSVVDPSDDSVYIAFQNSSGELALVNISSSGAVQKETYFSTYDVSDARISLDSSFVYVGATDSDSLRVNLDTAMAWKIEKSNLKTVTKVKYYNANISQDSLASACLGDSSNNFYGLARQVLAPLGNKSIIVKFNNSGTTLASKEYGGSSSDAFYAGDTDGTYLYASGTRSSNPQGAWLVKINNSDLSVADSVVATTAIISVSIDWNSSLDEGMWPVYVSAGGISFIRLDSNLDELNSIRFECSGQTTSTNFNGTLDSEGNMIGVFSGSNSGDNVSRGFLFKVASDFSGSGTILGVTYDQTTNLYSAGVGTDTYSGGSETTITPILSDGTGYTIADANIVNSTAVF